MVKLRFIQLMKNRHTLLGGYPRKKAYWQRLLLTTTLKMIKSQLMKF